MEAEKTIVAHILRWGDETERVEIKRKKGIWWMPWRQEAMKDVARCDKLRGVASKL